MGVFIKIATTRENLQNFPFHEIPFPAIHKGKFLKMITEKLAKGKKYRKIHNILNGFTIYNTCIEAANLLLFELKKTPATNCLLIPELVSI